MNESCYQPLVATSEIKLARRWNSWVVSRLAATSLLHEKAMQLAAGRVEAVPWQASNEQPHHRFAPTTVDQPQKKMWTSSNTTTTQRETF